MTVGQQLQQARLARNLSLGDVTKETKIQPWILEAFEADRVPENMSPIYVKGFLSTYARFLRLSPQALVAQLPQAAPEPEPQKELPPIPVQRRAVKPEPVVVEEVVQPVAVQAQPVKKVQIQVPQIQLPQIRLPQVQMRLPKLPEMPKIHVSLDVPRDFIRRFGSKIALGVACLAVVIVNPLRWVQKFSLPKFGMPRIASVAPAEKPPAAKHETTKKVARADSTAETASAKNASKSELSQSTSAAEAEVASKSVAVDSAAATSAPQAKLASVAPIADPLKPPAPPAPVLVQTKPLELDVTASRTTWVQVRADGKLVTQQRLQRGAKEHWMAKKQFELIVAKPSQVELTLNGQSISSFLIAHKGRVIINHRGISQLPDE